jgi:hypothetical protein
MPEHVVPFHLNGAITTDWDVAPFLGFTASTRSRRTIVFFVREGLCLRSSKAFPSQEQSKLHAFAIKAPNCTMVDLDPHWAYALKWSLNTLRKDFL